MWYWIIKVTFISLLLIFLLHNLYIFFKTTLTSPKVKDLVNKPQSKYDEIFHSLQNKNSGNSLGNNNHIDPNSMKNELKNYLKELNNSNSNTNVQINNALPNPMAGNPMQLVGTLPPPMSSSQDKMNQLLPQMNTTYSNPTSWNNETSAYSAPYSAY